MNKSIIQIPEDTKIFLQHMFKDELIDLSCNQSYKKYRYCSHANTCKFKRDKTHINKCIHTNTCEFFCHEYTKKEDLKIDDAQYQLRLEAAEEAKKRECKYIEFFFD